MSSFRTPEQINEYARTKHPGMVGVEVLKYTKEEACGRLKVTDQLIAGSGYLWAPVIVTLADWIAAVGTYSNIPPGHNFTTIEFKSNFMGSAKDGEYISAVATAQHIGSTTHVWDVDVVNDENHKKIAVFRCTQMILAPNS